jgi:hypothetical protein
MGRRLGASGIGALGGNAHGPFALSVQAFLPDLARLIPFPEVGAEGRGRLAPLVEAHAGDAGKLGSCAEPQHRLPRRLPRRGETPYRLLMAV